MQRRIGLAGKRLVEADAYGFLAHFKQMATVFLAAAIKQLHGVAGGHAQDAANIVGLGLGQVMLAKAQGASMKKRDSLM